MKKIAIIALLGLFSMSIGANARELFPIDWKQIESTVTEYTDSVKSLIVRLSGPTLDKTLTWEERRLAIYGQSIFSENKESDMANKAVEMYRAEKYKESIEYAKQALEINPLNVAALYAYKNCIAALVKSGDTSYSMDDGQILHNREQRIYNTIATTGDGSKENPFYVTCVAEEYYFMRYYLDLWEWSGQSLVGMCDVFDLTEESKYYSSKTIYFDTSRSLMITQKQFEKASISQ